MAALVLLDLSACLWNVEGEILLRRFATSFLVSGTAHWFESYQRFIVGSTFSPSTRMVCVIPLWSVFGAILFLPIAVISSRSLRNTVSPTSVRWQLTDVWIMSSNCVPWAAAMYLGVHRSCGSLDALKPVSAERREHWASQVNLKSSYSSVTADCTTGRLWSRYTICCSSRSGHSSRCQLRPINEVSMKSHALVSTCDRRRFRSKMPLAKLWWYYVVVSHSLQGTVFIGNCKILLSAHMITWYSPSSAPQPSQCDIVLVILQPLHLFSRSDQCTEHCNRNTGSDLELENKHADRARVLYADLCIYYTSGRITVSTCSSLQSSCLLSPNAWHHTLCDVHPSSHPSSWWSILPDSLRSIPRHT